MSRKLIVEIVGDSASLERAFKRSSKSAETFQRKMETTSRKTGRSFAGMSRSLKAGLGVGAGFGATAAIKTAVSAASDLEQQVSKTDAVFGESAKNVEAWSKKVATSFGISQREALTTASDFGALFAPIGLTGAAAAQQSEKLTQLGADLASFYNTDVQSAFDAIRSGIVGESEPLRKYGIRLSETRVQQVAMAETGRKLVKNLTDQEKTHARLSIITKDSSIAQGDFGRTSETAANQTKIFQANLANLEAELGKGIVPKLAGLTAGLNDFFAVMKPQRGGEKWWQKSGLQALQDLSENLPGGDWSKKHRLPLTKANQGPDAFAAILGPATSVGAAFQAAIGRATALGTKQARDTKAQLQAGRARLRQANEAARQGVLDRAEFNVEKTGATKTLKDDLAALRRYNALLTKRMKGGHGTLELEREQFHVQQQIADVLKQQADLARQTRKKLGVDVTRFQKSARGQYVMPGGGGGRGIHIANLNLVGVRNVSELENQLARRSKQRAHQRRRR